MECIESRDAGRFLPQVPSSAVPPTPLRRIWSKTSKRGCSPSTTTPRRSFFLSLSSFSPFRTSCRVSLMDGIYSLFFSICPCLGIKEKPISASHTHSGHVSRSICHFPVSRVHGRREEGVFIRRNETRLPSAVFLCFSCRIARVNGASTSTRRRLMPDLIERGWSSFQCISRTRLLPRCYAN